MSRVQFQPGLSMPEYYERYASEARCRAALEAARWPAGFACPACGGAERRARASSAAGSATGIAGPAPKGASKSRFVVA